MNRPDDFSPDESLAVRNGGDAPHSNRSRWALRVAGVAVLLAGWLAVALADFGTTMFVVDTVVFLAAGFYAFGAAVVSRLQAVNQERRLRLRLLLKNMELENLSLRDELTQLFNRRHLFDRLDRELETAKEFHRPLAFIAIKVDSLSDVNLRYGYGAGDRLLADFAGFLLDFSRATDVPARMGGNGFGVILPDTSKVDAFTMIGRLTEALAATPLMDGSRMDSAIVASFGVSGYPWGGDNVDAIVCMAETEAAPAASRDDEGEGQQQPLVDIPEAFRS